LLGYARKAERTEADVMSDAGITLCAVFRIPSAGREALQTYEDAVLPLVADHRGILQRHPRPHDVAAEIHITWFRSASHFEGYQAHPRRSAATPLFQASGAVAEVLTVTDVNDRD
jgi:hypothetical protein